jgi:hypothetical protein
MFKVTNELKLKILKDMGLSPSLDGDKAVAIIDYTAIAIKVLKAKKGLVTLQVSFEKDGKTIGVAESQVVSENCFLRIMTDDNFKCQGKITAE